MLLAGANALYHTKDLPLTVSSDEIQKMNVVVQLFLTNF